jgi:hypothetical protein
LVNDIKEKYRQELLKWEKKLYMLI